jgi:nicotinamidase-related amidase
MVGWKHKGRLALAGLALAGLAGAARAADDRNIVEAWRSIALPPPPALQPATVDPAHTALLILDMYPTSCNATERPSCVPTIPRIERLLASARAHKVAVIYSIGLASLNGPTRPVEALAPKGDEPTVRGAADKFIGGDLEKVLASRGITTIIVTGTSADGAVLYTASHAALIGMNAIIPVDGISSKNRFSELYTVWHFTNTSKPIVSHVTLTRTDLIGFR